MGVAIKKVRFVAFVVLVKLEAKTHHFSPFMTHLDNLPLAHEHRVNILPQFLMYT